ncbi:uncharacterized protein LOC128233393 isoform X1 [Mya arenaria]|uniref:uncharacterized protein LOC128233393 isoform X1 n=1 Tax=Mya arenaria TaxID=6604 RepID=UPI0022E733A1|nr:uncharacterized protein LOC128233393 isoform X1 [Mya arenaria]
MDYLLCPLKLCFILVVVVYAQDNIARMEFQRISSNQPDKQQMVTELLVDYLSNDTFQIMCKLNNMATLKSLVLWQADVPFQVRMQNTNPSITKSYRKPALDSDVSDWTAVGNFNNVTSSRFSTLGVSRPVSVFTCTEAMTFVCDFHYTDYTLRTIHRMVHKKLKVQDEQVDRVSPFRQRNRYNTKS